MITRRSFMASLLKGTTACMALPSALTYARSWKRVDKVWAPGCAVNASFYATWRVNSAWVNVESPCLGMPPITCTTTHYIVDVNGNWKRWYGPVTA